MNKKFFIFAVFLLMPLVFAEFIALGEMQKRGFCLPAARFMSTQEKLEKVIERINAKKTINLYVLKEAGIKAIGETARNVIPYNSVSDFLAANPDCCKIVLWDKVDFHGAILPAEPFRKKGLYGGTYTVDFKVRYVENGEHKQGTAEVSGMVNTCGEDFSPSY